MPPSTAQIQDQFVNSSLRNLRPDGRLFCGQASAPTTLPRLRPFPQQEPLSVVLNPRPPPPSPPAKGKPSAAPSELKADRPRSCFRAVEAPFPPFSRCCAPTTADRRSIGLTARSPLRLLPSSTRSLPPVLHRRRQAVTAVGYCTETSLSRPCLPSSDAPPPRTPAMVPSSPAAGRPWQPSKRTALRRLSGIQERGTIRPISFTIPVASQPLFGVPPSA